MNSIAVITALNEEIDNITRALTDVHTCDRASLHIVEGVLRHVSGDSIKVVAAVGGMGLVNAAATCQCLIDKYEPHAVIFSGIAGNLTADLHVNDIVLGQTLRYLDSDMRLIGQWKPKTVEFHSDEKLLQLACRVLQQRGIVYKRGIIASGNYFVDTQEKIAQVRSQTHADAVEMEGAAIAHVAARNNIPALIIRALSDNGDTDYEDFCHFDITEYANTASAITLDIIRNV